MRLLYFVMKWRQQKKAIAAQYRHFKKERNE